VRLPEQVAAAAAAVQVEDAKAEDAPEAARLATARLVLLVPAPNIPGGIDQLVHRI